MRSHIHIRSWWVTGMVAMLLYLVLQTWFDVALSAMETRQLFVWDLREWADAIFRVGGFSDWLAGFIVQFFHVRCLGPVLSAAALALIFHAVHSMCARISGLPSLMPLCLLPAAFILREMLCASFSFKCVTDFLLASCCVRVYAGCGGDGRSRTVMGSVLGVFLCLSTGSSVSGFLLAVLVFDLLKYRQVISWAVSGAAVAAVCIVSVELCRADDLRTVLLPEGLNIIMAWTSLAGCMAVYRVCGWLSVKGGMVMPGPAVAALLSVLAAGSGLWLVAGGRHLRQEQLYTLSYYAEMGDWDRVLKVCRHIDMNNYMLLNYANLALSHKGVLPGHFSDYRHDSVQALCIKPDLTAEGMKLRAMIYYHTGCIAGAQDMAFEADQYQVRPFLVEMLIRTNIIYGSYAVAEKYISLLEKTLFYRRRASSMRGLLDDGAVMLDVELATRRAGLPDKDAFLSPDYFPGDLMNALEGDPGNTAARDYLMVYLLISRDASTLVEFVRRFYGTPALETLTPDMQYGLLYATGDIGWCRLHGVDERMVARYLRGG